MTLYTYVPSKEELLDVMVDQEQLEQVTGQSNDAWWNEHQADEPLVQVWPLGLGGAVPGNELEICRSVPIYISLPIYKFPAPRSGRQLRRQIQRPLSTG